MDHRTDTHTNNDASGRPTVATSSTLDPGDPRWAVARGVALARTAIDAVRPDQLGLPTPCSDYDVDALLSHLVGVLRRLAAAGRGENPMSVVVEGLGLGPDEWSPAAAAAAHEVQAAWTDATRLDQMFVFPWATMPGRAVLATYLNELSVHTWDLARATGQQPDWDDDVLAVADAAIRLGLPAEHRRGAGLPVDPPFDRVVEVADDAPLVDRLVAWNGRRPTWPD
jgi:uncharacterized protein (TIGR03086 family)